MDGRSVRLSSAAAISVVSRLLKAASVLMTAPGTMVPPSCSRPPAHAAEPRLDGHVLSGQTASAVVGVVADVLTILLSAVALAAAAGALRGRNRIVPAILRRARGDTVGRVLRSLGMPSAIVRRHVRAVLTDRLTGTRPWTVPDELNWLNDVLGRDVAPVTFYGRGRGTGHPAAGSRAKLLTDLADAYSKLAGRLESRALILAEQVAAIRQEAELATRVARALREYAAFASTEVGATEFRPVVAREDLVVEVLEPPSAYPTRWPERLALSHRRRRILPDLPSAEARAAADGVEPAVLDTTAVEREALAGRLAGRRFDGILPSLAGWRFERDAGSGLGRLHLEIQECTFSSVMLAAYGEAQGVGRRWSGTTTDGPSPHLLTLSLMLATTDEKLVAVRRPSTMQMGERWVPSVSGNLEVGPRLGVQEDLDELGLLDLVAAVVREAREELGLDLAPHRVRCTGLARFWSEGEWNTNVLCFLAAAGVTSEQLRDQAVDADPVEGAYEVGDRLLLLPWADPRADAARLAEWAVTSADVAPHLVACLTTIAQGYAGSAPGPWTEPPTGPHLPVGALLLRTLG